MTLKDFIHKLNELDSETEILAYDDHRGDYFKPIVDKTKGKYFITGRKKEND